MTDIIGDLEKLAHVAGQQNRDISPEDYDWFIQHPLRTGLLERGIITCAPVAYAMLDWLREEGIADLPDPHTAPQPGAYHTSGPETERVAYERFAVPRAGTLREEVLNALYRHPDGLTDRELSRLTGRYLYSVAPRRTELARMGWVEDSGERRTTDGSLTGPSAVVWRLTGEGRRRWIARG